MTEPLIYLSAEALLDAYRAKTISPLEVAEAVLARIEAVDGRLNAFCHVDPETVLASARQSEQRWQKGEPVGLVDGVPTTIKDLNLTIGWPTRRGSTLIDPNQPWREDSPVVARLREHGAILIGKTTTPEFGWKGVTDSPLTGITRNPWNTALTPGGSSGGAAAACVAGMGALHVGSDGGGSIRIPSGFTGNFGLKPSFGRVPVYPASPFGTISHVGPMTRTVGDAALMMRVITEPDARDWFALPPAPSDVLTGSEDGVRGLRVAFSPTLGYVDVDPAVAKCVRTAAETFVALGADVEQVDPGFEDPTTVFNTIWKAGARNALGRFSDADCARLDPGLKDLYAAGMSLTLDDYLTAVNARTELGIHMKKFHEKFDLLITPALAVLPFEAGRLVPPDFDRTPKDEPNKWVYWTPFTYPFNLTQQPAASICCGFAEGGAEGGLPVGLQIVGPMFADALVLRAARAFEGACPLDLRPPL